MGHAPGVFAVLSGSGGYVVPPSEEGGIVWFICLFFISFILITVSLIALSCFVIWYLHTLLWGEMGGGRTGEGNGRGDVKVVGGEWG